MEIGQNIKEFTDSGEVVLIYTLCCGTRVLQVTNAAAAVVSYTIDGREMLEDTVKFFDSRVDSKTKLWSAEVEDEAIIFSSLEGDVPSRVAFSLTEDGFEISKVDGLNSTQELTPFYFKLAGEARASVAEYYDQTPVNELDRSREIAVRGWSHGLVFNVAQIDDKDAKIMLRSSLPLLKIATKNNSLALTPLDDASLYSVDSQEVPDGSVPAVDHTIIYSIKAK